MSELLNPVLVLNRAYIPVNITDYASAITLLYTDRCKALDSAYVPYSFHEWLHFSSGDQCAFKCISTVKYNIAVPEIVVLTQYDRLYVRDVRYSRYNILSRDKYRCAYCGHSFSADKLSIDHIIPKEKGGQNDWLNVITSCKTCNQLKGNKTLEQAGLKLKFKPKAPVWISPLSRPRVIADCRSWSAFLPSN